MAYVQYLKTDEDPENFMFERVHNHAFNSPFLLYFVTTTAKRSKSVANIKL